METKHTPGPWEWDGAEKISKPDGTVIAATNYKELIESYANAEFIVRACNAHDDLLEACQAIAALADGQGRANLMECAGQARAAIAKATETD